ncbi:hypothetical protein DFH29DRAFT_965715 [Suillus ampliporus]|nr:hypothetical protein DFH29DRAFT_965715 [Suillus ampliporus]
MQRASKKHVVSLYGLNCVDPPVFNLFENLRDGLVILQVFEKILPGSAVWCRVSKPNGGAQAVPPMMRDEEEQEQEDIGVTPNQSTLPFQTSGDHELRS